VSSSHVQRRSPLAAATLAFSLPLLALLGLLVAPGTLQEKLMLVVHGLNAQRPAHSYVFGGEQLALESRMLGIFLGFCLAVAVQWTTGGWRRAELPSRGMALVTLLFVAVMGLDGLNATLFDLGRVYLYEPRNETRLATGLLCGVATAAWVAPVVAFVFWRQKDKQPFFATRGELVRCLAIVAVAGAMVATGLPLPMFLSFVAVLSVVLSFWLVSTYVAVLSWQGVGTANAWPDLAGAAAVGFLLTIGELCAFAALRWWMETSLGIPWVV
jgi:uncharacterized membrane protein